MDEKTLIKNVRDYLLILDNNSRIDFWDKCFENYCKRCGDEEIETKCYCDPCYDL